MCVTDRSWSSVGQWFHCRCCKEWALAGPPPPRPPSARGPCRTAPGPPGYQTSQHRRGYCQGNSHRPIEHVQHVAAALVTRNDLRLTSWNISTWYMLSRYLLYYTMKQKVF